MWEKLAYLTPPPVVRARLYEALALLGTYAAGRGLVDGATSSVVVGVVGILFGITARANVTPS